MCLDETSKQLVVETRTPIPAKPGQPARHDYEYERNGVANLFMVFAPLEGWRHVKVTDRHAAVDYAHVLKELSDTHFPSAKQIQLVQDNLSTHTAASLYAAFPAPEARRLAMRFEWHYTPKHGSWLDMAESELAVLTTQCLSRRIPDKQTLEREVAAWQDHRNKHHAKADWQFTTDDARVKLKRLYPHFESLGRLVSSPMTSASSPSVNSPAPLLPGSQSDSGEQPPMISTPCNASPLRIYSNPDATPPRLSRHELRARLVHARDVGAISIFAFPLLTELQLASGTRLRRRRHPVLGPARRVSERTARMAAS